MSIPDRVAALRHRAEAEAGEREWRALVELADEMEREGRGRDDPRRALFSLLGDRWSMLILLVLERGTWRHATLKRIVGALSAEGAISQRILTLKLRQLERYGLLIRHSVGDAPKQVDYRLSAIGRDLMGHVDELGAWISQNRLTLEAARGDYDQRDS